MRKKEAAYRERQRLNLAQTVKANDVLKGVRARETEKRSTGGPGCGR
jgi:hypothetical protein